MGGGGDVCTRPRSGRAASAVGLGVWGCNFGHSKRLEISFPLPNNVTTIVADSRKDVVALSRYTCILVHKEMSRKSMNCALLAKSIKLGP